MPIHHSSDFSLAAGFCKVPVASCRHADPSREGQRSAWDPALALGARIGLLQSQTVTWNSPANRNPLIHNGI